MVTVPLPRSLKHPLPMPAITIEGHVWQWYLFMPNHAMQDSMELACTPGLADSPYLSLLQGPQHTSTTRSERASSMSWERTRWSIIPKSEFIQGYSKPLLCFGGLDSRMRCPSWRVTESISVRGRERTKTLGSNVLDLLTFLRALPDEAATRATCVLTIYNTWVARSVTYVKAGWYCSNLRGCP